METVPRDRIELSTHGFSVRSECKPADEKVRFSQRTDDPQERWRAVVGYEGWYEVSDLGRVRRVRPAQSTHAGKILRSGVGSNGYPLVALCRGYGKQTLPVHLLVARAFLGAAPDGLEVDHVNGVRADARLSNLEYVTRSENGRRGWVTNPHRSPRRPLGLVYTCGRCGGKGHNRRSCQESLSHLPTGGAQ